MIFKWICSAFQKLGLDCANWTEPVYADLLRYDLSESFLYNQQIKLIFFSHYTEKFGSLK